MKKRMFALALAACLTLSGCSAMLERSYETSSVHVDRPVTAEDPSVLRVENYRELVSAVLYLIAQGREEGTIQLHDYSGSVENDLAAACLEVATEDPLGAYAVDYIKHEYTQVMSYYQATVSIRYRRTQEQIRSMVNVTGTSAIRSELREALAAFSAEVVLRVAYFSGDADSITQLIRQAYYDTPSAALGLPQAQVSLYPNAGRERIVEIFLTYPLDSREQARQSEALTAAARRLAEELITPLGRDRALECARLLTRQTSYDAEGPSTPYAALVGGRANDEGLALAYALLCRQGNMACEVVEGTLAGEPRFFTALTLAGEETLYLDPAQREARLYTARELLDLGYDWPDAPPAAEEAGAFAAGRQEG